MKSNKAHNSWTRAPSRVSPLKEEAQLQCILLSSGRARAQRERYAGIRRAQEKSKKLTLWGRRTPPPIGCSIRVFESLGGFGC